MCDSRMGIVKVIGSERLQWRNNVVPRCAAHQQLADAAGDYVAAAERGKNRIPAPADL